MTAHHSSSMFLNAPIDDGLCDANDIIPRHDCFRKRINKRQHAMTTDDDYTTDNDDDTFNGFEAVTKRPSSNYRYHSASLIEYGNLKNCIRDANHSVLNNHCSSLATQALTIVLQHCMLFPNLIELSQMLHKQVKSVRPIIAFSRSVSVPSDVNLRFFTTPCDHYENSTDMVTNVMNYQDMRRYGLKCSGEASCAFLSQFFLRQQDCPSIVAVLSSLDEPGANTVLIMEKIFLEMKGMFHLIQQESSSMSLNSEMNGDDWSFYETDAHEDEDEDEYDDDTVETSATLPILPTLGGGDNDKKWNNTENNVDVDEEAMVMCYNNNKGCKSYTMMKARYIYSRFHDWWLDIYSCLSSMMEEESLLSHIGENDHRIDEEILLSINREDRRINNHTLVVVEEEEIDSVEIFGSRVSLTQIEEEESRIDFDKYLINDDDEEKKIEYCNNKAVVGQFEEPEISRGENLGVVEPNQSAARKMTFVPLQKRVSDHIIDFHPVAPKIIMLVDDDIGVNASETASSSSSSSSVMLLSSLHQQRYQLFLGWLQLLSSYLQQLIVKDYESRILHTPKQRQHAVGSGVRWTTSSTASSSLCDELSICCEVLMLRYAKLQESLFILYAINNSIISMFPSLAPSHGTERNTCYYKKLIACDVKFQAIMVKILDKVFAPLLPVMMTLSRDSIVGKEDLMIENQDISVLVRNLNDAYISIQKMIPELW